MKNSLKFREIHKLAMNLSMTERGYKPESSFHLSFIPSTCLLNATMVYIIIAVEF